MSTGGFSKARLERLHDVMAGHVERGEVPAIATLVSRREEVHVDSLGSLTVGGTEPVRRDTIFRIASMTKPVIAAATMILVEECVLRLDEPVDRFLPELADRTVLRALDGPLDDTVPANRPITVRDLLTFRMGFGIVMAMPGTYPIQQAADELALGQGPPSPAGPPDPDEWIRRFGTLPLIHQPGERWMYNTGSDVLGVLLARASGRPLPQFLAERLFEPLGMVDSGFHVPPEKIDRLVTGYGTNWTTGAFEAFDEGADGQWSRPPAFPSGGGGLVSTLDDYLAFGRMLLAGGRHGGERILSRPSVETMTADQLTAEQKAKSGLVAGYFDSHGWGFGLGVTTRRVDIWEPVGTYGWDGGLGTSWRNDPSEDVITILLTNRAWMSPDPPAVHRDFWTSVYQAFDD